MKWYERELKKWDIDIRLNFEVKDITALLKAYDDVIVSVGTRSFLPTSQRKSPS